MSCVQAVLVRDEASRTALYQWLGDQADATARSSTKAHEQLLQQLLAHTTLDEARMLLRMRDAGRVENAQGKAERHVRLGQLIAKHLLILTATECKGLEFQVC